MQHVEFFKNVSYFRLWSFNRPKQAEKHQIFIDSHLLNQYIALRTELNHVDQVTFRKQVDSESLCSAGSGFEFPCEHADCCCLPCAIVAKQYKNLILEQSKCQVVHSDLFAEGFDEVCDLQCLA